MIWKDIPGFEGRYQVSDEGEIRSLDRPVRTKSESYCIRKGKVLKPQNTWDGYYTIGMYDDSGKYYIRLLHRVVAEVFIPNPNNYPVINHLDCNPHNNHVDNLEWTTVQGNTLHAVANGRFNIDPEKIHKAAAAGVAKTRKPVRCIETGQEFYTLTALRSYLGFNCDILWYLIHDKPIKGLHYEFVRDEDKQYLESKKEELRTGVKTINHHFTPVRCIETGVVYPSQIAAERELGLCYGYVLESLKTGSAMYGKSVSFEYA